MKEFSETQNVGKVRYVVSHHNGAKLHKDGSPFFDVATFQNKRKKARFVKGLLASGYKAR